jgi:ribosome-associated protein
VTDESVPIELQAWLKMQQWVQSGGEAKQVIQGGLVRLNGEVETRRRKKLQPGDVVEYGGRRGSVEGGGPQGE